MSPRKPPVLANWLLNRSGFTGQNPPLAGDLLEEFRNGRSSAWYWRQTLAVIAAGLVLNARLYRRYLMAAIIGWAAEAGVTFCLWWFWVPPQLHGTAEALAACLVAIGVIVLAVLTKRLLSKQPAFVMAQAQFLLLIIKDVLLPDPDPGPARLFTTLK